MSTTALLAAALLWILLPAGSALGDGPHAPDAREESTRLLDGLAIEGAPSLASDNASRGSSAGDDRSRRIVSSTPLGPDLSVGIESEVAYRRGVLALLSGDPRGAAEAFDESIQTRPARTGAHVLLGASLLAAGSLRGLGEFPVAVRCFLADFEAQTRIVVNGSLALGAGLALLVLGALLAPILRALPSLSHEISEALPQRLPPGLRRAYPPILMVAPIYLMRPWAWPAGIIWLLALYALLVRRSLGRVERHILALWAIMVAGLPVALVALGVVAAPAVPRSPAFSVARSEDPFLYDYTRQSLEDALGWEGNDSELLLELALNRRRAGRVQEAAQLYERLLQKNENHTAARVNLGNILHARGESEAAIAEYARALELDDRSAAAHYDMGQALVDGFDFGKAKTHFRTASSLNFDFMRSLSQASAGGDEMILVDEVADAGQRWDWLRQQNGSLRQISWTEALNAMHHVLLPPSLLGTLLLGLAFAGAYSAGRLPRRAEPCAACGRPVCRRCRVRISKRNFCDGCAAVARLEAPLDTVEAEKRKRYRAAHTRHFIVASLLAIALPGAGHVYAGQGRRGHLYLFLAGIAIFFVVSGGGPLQPLPQLDGEIFAAVRPVLILVLVNLHLAGVLHFFTLARRGYS